MNNSSAPDSDHSNPLNPAAATPLVQIFVPTLPKAAIIGKASATPQADPTVQQRSFPDGYLTDYSVFLVGNVGTEFVRQFRVSGRTPVWLDNREFVLLYLLAKHADGIHGLVGAAFTCRGCRLPNSLKWFSQLILANRCILVSK